MQVECVEHLSLPAFAALEHKSREKSGRIFSQICTQTAEDPIIFCRKVKYHRYLTAITPVYSRLFYKRFWKYCYKCLAETMGIIQM